MCVLAECIVLGTFYVASLENKTTMWYANICELTDANNSFIEICNKHGDVVAIAPRLAMTTLVIYFYILYMVRRKGDLCHLIGVNWFVGIK